MTAQDSAGLTNKRRTPRASTATTGRESSAADRQPTGEPVGTLGVRLKRVREKSGMSLREVARQLGVSASFVSQMENGKSQPSVATLYSLAQLLGISIDELFATDERDPGHSLAGVVEGGPIQAPVAGTTRRPRHRGGSERVSRSGLGSLEDLWPGEQGLAKLSVTRPGERHVLEMDSGVIWEQLADNTGTGLDFIEIIYPAHSSSTNDQRMLQHAGSEFGYLIEGELEITVGFEVFTLHAGEAVGFNSAVPHLLANKTDRAARGIWCVRHGYV
jgi:transcriptional regulator with XRE-family HTH domain